MAISDQLSAISLLRLDEEARLGCVTSTKLIMRIGIADS